MSQEPSTSAEHNISSSESSSESASLHNDEEVMRDNLTNALIHCKSLLKAENLLTDTPPKEVSAASIAMGEEIFKEIICMLQERTIIYDEDLILQEETDVMNIEEYTEVRFTVLLFSNIVICESVYYSNQ